MFDIHNNTPFEAASAVLVDPEGYELAVVAVKGTFTIPKNGNMPEIATEQIAVLAHDDYGNDPENSGISYPADLIPGKKGTDVGLAGTAYSPGNRPVTQLKATLQAGHLKKDILILGDRYWTTSLFTPGYTITNPRPFNCMPLGYENSYGGTSRDKTGETVPYHENPMGKGFVLPGQPVGALLLPNLENPKKRIKTYRKTYPPATFGFSRPSSANRLPYAGTHDEAWIKERRPLHPLDLDLRFFNYAQPELVADGFFKGGETVTLTHLTPDGHRSFKLPEYGIMSTFCIKGQLIQKKAVIHTLMIEPDQNRFTITWWAAERIFKSPYHVEWIGTELINR